MFCYFFSKSGQSQSNSMKSPDQGPKCFVHHLVQVRPYFSFQSKVGLLHLALSYQNFTTNVPSLPFFRIQLFAWQLFFSTVHILICCCKYPLDFNEQTNLICPRSISTSWWSIMADMPISRIHDPIAKNVCDLVEHTMVTSILLFMSSCR